MSMKSIGLAGAGAAALVLLSASAWAADVSGTVDVTGSVAGKCSVQPDGADGATISGTIGLGELAGADGTLLTSLTGSTSGSPAGGITRSYHVVCNTSAPTVTLSATSMDNTAAPPAGYANSVRYTAELDVDLAAGGSSVFTYNTATAASTGSSPIAAVKNANNNVRVKIYGLNTPNATDILVAGGYGSTNGGTGGVISITINNN